MKDPPAQAAAQSGQLLAELQAGDAQAAAAVFDRYAERLTRLVRSRLAARLAARVDPEDIVLSAYRSFFVAARDGRFTAERPGDLWRLLVEVTLHKLFRQAQRHQAARRSVSREEYSEFDSRWLAMAAREPSSEEAAIAAEELELLLAGVPPRARPAIELRLQGYEQSEIARQLGCSERTVRRWLEAARKWLLSRAGGHAIAWPTTPETAPRGATSVGLPPQPGQLKWSDFILKQQIGAGATGKVYRAVERSSQRPVAVKFLKKSVVHEQTAVEQFLRELRIVAQMQHPGIVGVEGIGRTPGGGYFLVMELVAGSDLHALRSAGRVQPQQAAAWVAAAARIVQHAHERGIVHCDLKPSNLLVDEQGNVRVTDFGLAVRLTDGASGMLMAGTPAFMAPEQVDPCWGPISPRTDVWGLGAVLYFLLHGIPPHRGENVADVLARVVSGRPVTPPCQLTTDPNSPLIAVCSRSLMKMPAERYESAADFAQAIENTDRFGTG